MKAHRVCCLASAAFAVALCPAFTETRVTPVLPEIEKHLSEARDGLQRGDFDIARGHAQAVLVGDDVTYDMSFESIQEVQRSVCVRALKAAFQVWERELDGTLHFRLVGHADHPQISVVFKPRVQMRSEEVAGFTNWKRCICMDRDKWIESTFHADMQIRTTDLESNPMKFETIRHEACHETGHVLGLDDSQHPGDLMGPLDISHPVNGPTASEASCVRNLRDQARHIDALAMSQQAGKL